MHALNMLEYGHQMVLDTVTKVEPGLAGMPGACGEWSIRDIVAHLASFEALILDAIASLTPGATRQYSTGSWQVPTPTTTPKWPGVVSTRWIRSWRNTTPCTRQ